MIRTAGLGVCMENGCQALKDISGMICPPVEQGGLARRSKPLRISGEGYIVFRIEKEQSVHLHKTYCLQS